MTTQSDSRTNTQIGPVPIDRLVLCSADAGPGAQANGPGDAGHFFPQAAWVGALRNTSQALNCRFCILTTGHGLVGPDDVIGPYDKHILEFPEWVTETWQRTVPRFLGQDQYDLMVFYAGGCPREEYLRVLLPIVKQVRISLVTFGRPNMFDVGRTEQFVHMIEKGTTLDTLRMILKRPERLAYYPVAG
jgi:hypothetical protein